MAEIIVQSKIKYTTLYPTSLIVNGLDKFGYELAKSLSDQGGYVIVVDNLDKEESIPEFSKLKNVAFLDFEGIADMVDDIRRLDYVFYLNHNSYDEDSQFSSQEFLAASSYLNQILNLAVDFEALFLLTNSVRAHKYLLSIDRYTDKFVESNVSEESYTEAEFVRYSESLAMEYKRNKDLEVKIVRMGELLGEGIELSRNTYVGRMIWQAINKEDLILDRDGLDSEYYVHIIDAVYGVLKAQFTKNTKEFISTLSYAEPLTQLSLAYKIQEYEIDAGDIKFEEDEDSKIRLNMSVYKAAKNLNDIGWQPKVDLDSALIQSLAYAKKLRNHLLEADKKGDADEVEGIIDQLPANMKNTALARLIEERKRNEASSKSKYSQTVDKIKDKQRDVPFIVRLRRGFIRRYDRFKKNFEFLQDITLAELGVYSLLGGIFVFIFFTLLSPLMSIIRDFVIIKQDIDEATVAAESGEWENLASNSREARARIDSLNETIENADFLFTITGRKQFRQELLGMTQSFGFYADTLVNLSESYDGTEKVFVSAGGSLVYRPTNSSVLSISDGSAQDVVADTGELRSKNEIAQRSLDNSRRIYERVDRNLFPAFILEFSDSLLGNTEDLSKMIARNEKAITIADNLQRESYNFGFVIQDNIRSTYNGGEIVGVGMFEYSNGNLTGVQLLPVQNIEFTVADLTADELTEVQRISSQDSLGEDGDDAQEVLKYVLPGDHFDSILQKSLASTFGKEIHDVSSMNLIGLSDMLEHYGQIQVNDETIDSTNLLQQINLLQEDSLNSRNKIITNIAAVLLTKTFSFEQEQLQEKFTLASTLYEGNNLYINQSVLDKINIQQSEQDVLIGGVTENPDNFTVNPQIDINLTGRLLANSITHAVEINAVNAEDMSDLIFCTGKELDGFDLDQVSIQNYTTLNFNERACVLFDLSRQRTFKFNYTTKATAGNYQGRLAISPGIGLRYDVEISYPNNYLLTESVPTANKRENTVFYSGETFSDFKYLLKFN